MYAPHLKKQMQHARLAIVITDGNQVRMGRQAGSRNMSWKGVELFGSSVMDAISVIIKLSQK